MMIGLSNQKSAATTARATSTSTTSAAPRPAGSDAGKNGKNGGRATLELLRIGELARRCGKSVRALHLYEDLGLLQPTSRTKGRFRLYDPAAADRVQWIGKLQEMGFSLTQIQQFLRSWLELKTAPEAMRHIRGIFTDRLRDTEETIRRLSELRAEMEESLKYLEKCHQCTPATTGCDGCEVEHAPLLVAEFRQPATVVGADDASASPVGGPDRQPL